MPADWIDISVPIDPATLPTWPGSPPVRLTRIHSLAGGEEWNETELACSVHTGTHIDAPAHFVAGGGTVDELSLGSLNGPCRVVGLERLGMVTAGALEAAGIPSGALRLLLKTDNSGRWGPHFDPGFTALDAAAAEWVVARGIRLIGIDYLSIQAYEESNEVHRCLLEAGVIVLEGIILAGVDPGLYELVCLPLRLAGAEGAPARAMIRPLRSQERA